MALFRKSRRATRQQRGARIRLGRRATRGGGGESLAEKEEEATSLLDAFSEAEEDHNKAVQSLEEEREGLRVKLEVIQIQTDPES